MLTTQEIYNFLVNADSGLTQNPESQVPTIPPGPPLPPMPMDDGRIDALRARLQALIGPVTKQAAQSDPEVDRVFGLTTGEQDPEAEPLDPEWEEVLRMITEEWEPDSMPATVSLRSK